ncbi:MAG TPA: hypothetical protein VGJ05_01905 [Fimbriiglobus sp.]|jgi:hypothetical protein
MNISAQQIVRQMQPDRPADVRAAGLTIASELGVKTADVVAAVMQRLDDPAAGVRNQAILAAGKLKIDKALPKLLDKIGRGGEEAAQAARAAAALGAKAAKALHDLLPRVAPGVRKYIAVALAEAGTTGSDAAAVKVFLDADPAVADAAANMLIGRVPDLSDAKKKSLAAALVAVASAKKPKLPAHAEGPVVRLLLALNVTAAAPYLWTHTGPGHQAEVRAAALQAVGGWIDKPTKEQWDRLFACARDPDFRVVAPALRTLDRLPFSAKQLPEWGKLFFASDVATRRLAVEKAGDSDTAAVAEGLLVQLHHPDRGVRDASRTKLAKLDHGRAAITKALLGFKTAEDAWALAKAVAPHTREFPAKLRDEIFNRACKHLEAGDHKADPLFFLLREADPNDLRDKLFTRAVSLRKKGKFDAALSALKFLGRDPAVGFPIRLELACVGLKSSGKEIEREARQADPCLTQFAHLAEHDQPELMKQLGKATWLDADDLFYLGFHFAEDMGRLKSLGAEVLEMVVKKYPKAKVAAAAKGKLKTVAV